MIQKYDVLRGFTPPCPLSFPLFFHEVSVLYIVRGFSNTLGLLFKQAAARHTVKPLIIILETAA